MSSQKTLAALRLLSERHIEYIVVGMVAGVLHGAPVTTFDLDVVHRRTTETSIGSSQSYASSVPSIEAIPETSPPITHG